MPAGKRSWLSTLRAGIQHAFPSPRGSRPRAGTRNQMLWRQTKTTSRDRPKPSCLQLHPRTAHEHTHHRCPRRELGYITEILIEGPVAFGRAVIAAAAAVPRGGGPKAIVHDHH